LFLEVNSASNLRSASRTRKPVPASLTRSCPRSFRDRSSQTPRSLRFRDFARVARFAQDDTSVQGEVTASSASQRSCSDRSSQIPRSLRSCALLAPRLRSGQAFAQDDREEMRCGPRGYAKGSWSESGSKKGAQYRNSGVPNRAFRRLHASNVLGLCPASDFFQ
jgi:hypothetical protein